MSSLSNAEQTPKHRKLIELGEHLKTMARILSRAKQAEHDEISGAAFWSLDHHPSLADDRDDEVSARPQPPLVLVRPDRFFL